MPEPNPNPGNGAALAPWAYSRLTVVEAVDRDYPQLLERARTQGEHHRGAFVDQVAHRLNRLDNTTRWGRKARREGDATSLNDDALTYLMPGSPANKKLIDVVMGERFAPGWDLRPASEEHINGSPNGYWHPPLAADLDAPQPQPEPQPEPEPQPQPEPEPTPDEVVRYLLTTLQRLDAQSAALLRATLALAEQAQTLNTGLAALHIAVAQQTYSGEMKLPKLLGGGTVTFTLKPAPPAPPSA